MVALDANGYIIPAVLSGFGYMTNYYKVKVKMGKRRRYYQLAVGGKASYAKAVSRAVRKFLDNMRIGAVKAKKGFEIGFEIESLTENEYRKSNTGNIYFDRHRC